MAKHNGPHAHGFIAAKNGEKNKCAHRQQSKKLDFKQRLFDTTNTSNRDGPDQPTPESVVWASGNLSLTINGRYSA